MAINFDKDDLFTDFYHGTQIALGTLEGSFGLDGVYEKVLGDGDTATEEKALRGSPAWAALCRLYDYALYGRLSGYEPQDIVIDGAGVLGFVTTENHKPEERWQRIVAMADARFGLDDGQPIELGRVALLANVDVRTVRNAVSNGEMLAVKEGGLQFVDNASARRWLASRRGFKPTEVSDSTLTLPLDKVSTPAEFASLLVSQRQRLGMDQAEAKLVVMHPAVSTAALAQLESGVFSLPLDAALPLADFYQLPRAEFLACVMRVFFRAELDVLMGASQQGKAS